MVRFDERSLNVFDPTPELLEANPFGRVPALKLPDGTPVIDSNAILALFYQEAGASPWVPKSSVDRIRAARVSGMALTLCELAVAYFLESLREHPDHKMREETDNDFTTALGKLEKEIRANGHVTDGPLSQADIDLAVALSYLTLRWHDGWKAQFPRLATFSETLEKRPSFVATVPPPM